MHRARPATRRLCLVAGVALGAALTACHPDPPPASCRTSADSDVALALGARANSAVPSLPPPVNSLVTGAARAGRKVTVIRIDGAPEVVYDQTFHSDAGNETAREQDFRQHFARFRQVLQTRTHATHPEADPLAALALAARSVPVGGTVVLADSGLQTVEPLRFQDDHGALLDAEPAEVVAFLKKQDLLPDLTDRVVMFLGLGNTAPPQSALDTHHYNQLRTLWQAIAKASHAACVQPDASTAPPVSVTGVPPVSSVPVPRPPDPPASCGETVLAEGNHVGFLPDRDVFRDPGAARETIQKIADVMRDRRQTAELIGTTASVGPTPGRVALSQRRAEAVRRVLVDLGVPADRVTARGVGTDWPGHVPDIGRNGVLLPGPAAENRKVIVRLACRN